MTKTFTQNDLIRYIYKETSDEENAEIEGALLCNAELLESFKEISLMKRKLQRALKDPEDSVINYVLAYSKSLNIQVE